MYLKFYHKKLITTTHVKNTHTHVYIIHTYQTTYIHTHIHKYVHMFYIHVYVYTCINIYMYTCIHTHT